LYAKNRNVRVDVTPEYMLFPNVPKIMRQVLGSDIKIIFMLRNPIARAYSHYWMSYRRGIEQLSFFDAIKCEKGRILEGNFELNHFSYATRGLYASHIERYLEFFRKEQMKFVFFEDLVSNPQKSIDEVLSFLGVESLEISKDKLHGNKARVPRALFFRRLMRNPPHFLRLIFRKLPFLKSFVWKIVEFFSPGDPRRHANPTKMDSLRLKIRALLDRVNEKTLETPVMSNEAKSYLDAYFEEDSKKLELIVDRPLPWR
jgi:hypothetical protein